MAINLIKIKKFLTNDKSRLKKPDIVDKLHEFDELCLPPVKDLSASAIKNIRLHEKVSQAVFAKFLNTTLSTVRQWEQGGKHPRGTSLRLLNLVAEKGLGILLSGDHNEGTAA